MAEKKTARKKVFKEELELPDLSEPEVEPEPVAEAPVETEKPAGPVYSEWQIRHKATRR